MKYCDLGGFTDASSLVSLVCYARKAELQKGNLCSAFVESRSHLAALSDSFRVELQHMEHLLSVFESRRAHC
jgi:hypothetical protein